MFSNRQWLTRLSSLIRDISGIICSLVLVVVVSAVSVSLQAAMTGTQESMAASVVLPAVSPAFMRDIVLDDETREVTIDQSIRYSEDAKRQLTIDDLLAIPNQLLLENKTGPFNIGYSESAVWLKIPLYYTGKQDKKLYLMELDVPLLDRAELFIVAPNGKVQTSHVADYDIPLAKRLIRYPSYVFPVEINKGEKLTLYLRVESEFSIHIPLRIYTPIGFAEHVSIVELFHGIFIGCMLIMIVYNFFVFISVREKAYFYYVFYITAYFIFLMTERVHGLQVFGSIPTLMHKKYLALYIWISWIGAITMARYFLDTARLMKGMDAILKLIIQASVISIVISFFADTKVTIQWAVFAPFLYTLIISYAGYAAMSKGLHGANLYCLAWVLNFSGAAVYGLTVTGYLPYNVFTASSPQIGIVCQLIFISFALADRIKTAQKQALEANTMAMLHLQRYQSLFDNAVEGIYQMSLNRRFIEANPAMARLLGYASPARMMEKVTDGIQACYLEEADRTRVTRTLESGQNVEAIEACYQNLEGNLRWAESKIQIIYDENGDPSHLEGSFVDITEKKEKETYQKEREQDRMQRQVAEASASAKSQFLANMSHEIRTPLTAIIGYGESLLEEELTEVERQKSAETVVRSGRHLLKLINDILDHSKIDANKLQVDIIPVPLLEILAEVRAYFAPKATQKSLQFSIQYDFPLPEQIQTDPTRFKQILINLCGNALKFTERGSIRVGVRCDKDKEMLFVKVTDTGIGLKPEQMSRLFDPFAQARPSIAREYGGTGLGLTISKKLAEMLGGTIRVASTYGQGSEFEASISTGALTNRKFIQYGTELSGSQTQVRIVQAPQLSGRILYAEDNEVNRRLIDQLVSKTGAKIKMVVNGAEALKAATDEQFDLILMDIQMPVMDGRDAAQAIRKSGNRTPIVALTANIMAEDLQEYQEVGCVECLSKPVDKARFYTVLSRYLKTVDQRPNLPVERADRHPPEMAGFDAAKMLPQVDDRRPEYALTVSDSKENKELRVIVDHFVHSLPDQVAALRAHSKDNKWSEVRKIAHQLKGVGSSLGFPELTEKAKRVDIAIKQEQADCYPELVESVVDELEKIVDSYGLSGMIKGDPTAGIE